MKESSNPLGQYDREIERDACDGVLYSCKGIWNALGEYSTQPNFGTNPNPYVIDFLFSDPLQHSVSSLRRLQKTSDPTSTCYREKGSSVKAVIKSQEELQRTLLGYVSNSTEFPANFPDALFDNMIRANVIATGTRIRTDLMGGADLETVDLDLRSFALDVAERYYAGNTTLLEEKDHVQVGRFVFSVLYCVEYPRELTEELRKKMEKISRKRESGLGLYTDGGTPKEITDSFELGCPKAQDEFVRTRVRPITYVMGDDRKRHFRKRPCFPSTMLSSVPHWRIKHFKHT